ncbi:MAG: hypothetical protein AAGG81_00360, partial [Chlamydiota bacterium]
MNPTEAQTIRESASTKNYNDFEKRLNTFLEEAPVNYQGKQVRRMIWTMITGGGECFHKDGYSYFEESTINTTKKIFNIT